MNKIALITGATAGIGKAIAVKYAHNGINVIISGRRKERLSQLKSKLERETESKVLILEMDVTDRKDVEEAIRYIPDE
mgnify:FL=1